MRRDFYEEARTTMGLVKVGAMAVILGLVSCCGQGEVVAADHNPTRGGVRMNRQVAKRVNIRLGGELGTRYSASVCNLLTRPDRYAVQTYVSNITGEPGALWLGWPGDQTGRMLSVMDVADDYGWTPVEDIRRSVGDAVLPLQTKLGNFGPELPLDHKDRQLMSGNAFALRGLMDAYADTHEERYLVAARRLGRYFESTFDRWKASEDGHVDEFYGHCIDGLVKLYEAEKEPWALDLAKRIGTVAGRGKHTHHTLTMYRGFLDLYKVTSDEKLLDTAADYLAWCKENRFVTYGLSEWLPRYGEDEGCLLADYVLVNLMMFAAGRDEYLEEGELAMVNHFFMNQFHTGGFGHRAIDEEIVGGKNWQGWDGRYGSENPGCCSMWGQWALGQVGQYAVTKNGNAFEVNLYPEVDVGFPRDGARFAIKSDFPKTSKAIVKIQLDKPGKFSVRLRVPKWVENVTAKLNGAPVKTDANGGRLVLDRKWHSGDFIELGFKSQPRLVAWPDAKSDRFGIFDGPLCLGLSSAAGDVEAFKWVLVDGEGRLVLSSSGRPQAVNDAGEVNDQLRPICEDWQSPNVNDPNRLRVLFRKKVNG